MFKMKLLLIINSLFVFLFPLLVHEASSQENKAIFKNQLHVISHVMTKKDTDRSFIGEFKHWDLDEYIDREQGVSSLQLFDVGQNTEDIYFNDQSQYKTVLFNRLNNTCRATRNYNVPLNILRLMMKHVLPDRKLDFKTTEIAIGSISALQIVESNLEGFQFVSSEFDDLNLRMVEIYENVTTCSSDFSLFGRKNNKLVITVRILNGNPGSSIQIEKGAIKTLAQINPENLAILSITFCKVAIKLYARTQGVPFECLMKDVMANVEYHYIEELTGATLIGEDISKNREYDFNREPFMQPTGIGCWDPDQGCVGYKRFSPPSLQFSAEYITSLGSQQLEYVAYDGYRDILRLDSRSHSSVYDLKSVLSYHRGLFNAAREQADTMDRIHSCVVLNHDPNRFKAKIMMESLLGISKDKRACHLGSKIVDHIHYEVYEREITFEQGSGSETPGYRLPILLEPTKFSMPIAFSADKRFFLTYYVQEFDNQADTTAFEENPKNSFTQGKSIIPKFIELWQYTTKSEERTLINRLEFTEFSWSLDIAPADDPESRDLSRLFEIETCSSDRSHQLQLRFRITPYIAFKEKASKVKEISDKNPRLLREILHERICAVFDIPRLNLIKMQVSNSPDRGFTVDSRVVDLLGGLTKVKRLGYGNYMELTWSFNGSILSDDFNVHSLQDCRLQSLEEPQQNSLIYCQAVSLCRLVKQRKDSEPLDSLTQQGNPRLAGIDDIERVECVMEQFDWAEKVKDDETSVVRRIKENDHRLFGQSIDFKMKYTSEDTPPKTLDVVEFRGFTNGLDISLINPRGAQNPKSALVGIRYTTMSEEPTKMNINRAFSLRYFDDDKFKYCHLACQLDEYCGSFSYCSRRNKLQIESTDCILSTVRLSSERVGEIDDLIRDDQSDLLLRVTSYSDSQEFIFKRQAECSIHPKDFLASYKMTGTLRVKKREKKVASSNEKDKSKSRGGSSSSGSAIDESNRAYQDQSEAEQLAATPISVGIVTTLEDCADQDYESSLWTNLARSNFTYCPMGSMCILYDEDIDKLPNKQVCYLYEKTHLQYYSSAPQTRMSIQLADKKIYNSNIQMQNINIKKDDFISSSLSSIKEELEAATDTKLARSIEGLTSEQCARDCNLMQSKCLAFDTCTLSDIIVCNLYSVRSRLMFGANKQLGYLPIEKPFYEKSGGEHNINNETNNEIKLFSSPECDHFYLKDTYFNIRLQQLMEPSPPSSPGSSSPSQQASNKPDTLETNLINADLANGEEALKKALEEQRSKQKASLQSQLSSGSGAVHVFLLFFGAISSSLIFLYGGQAKILLTDLIQSWQAKRSASYTNHRISQLALTNNQEI